MSSSTLPVGPDRTAPVGRPPGGSRNPRRTAVTALLRRLHFYAGILIAPFLVVATVSGGLYAVAPTLEQWVYADQLRSDATVPALPLQEQVDAAAALRPDLTVTGLRPAPEPGATTRVLFDDPSLGESERLVVFIDPTTGASPGQLVTYGSAGALPLRTTISQVHRHLLLGEPGRLYSELAASWLWVVTLGGLALWVMRYRQRRGKASAGADRTRLLRFEDGSVRGRTLSRHAVAGVWISLGLLFLSATGLTWSKYAGANVGELRTAFNWSTPTLESATGGGDHAGHGADPDRFVEPETSPASVDQVLAAARGAGLDGQVEITVPAAGSPAVVTETRQPWQFSPDSVAVDPQTGTVIEANRFADWPLAAKLTTWGIATHMGIQFGLANQLALLALAVVLLTIIVRGYLMWWQRRPRRGAQPVGRAPARGALRELGLPTTVGLGVLVIAVGWFLPLLGWSLLAFLLVDLALGWRPRVRT